MHITRAFCIENRDESVRYRAASTLPFSGVHGNLHLHHLEQYLEARPVCSAGMVNLECAMPLDGGSHIIFCSSTLFVSRSIVSHFKRRRVVQFQIFCSFPLSRLRITPPFRSQKYFLPGQKGAAKVDPDTLPPSGRSLKKQPPCSPD